MALDVVADAVDLPSVAEEPVARALASLAMLAAAHPDAVLPSVVRWSPSTHAAFSARSRAVVRTVLLAHASHSARGTFGLLPHDALHLVLAHAMWDGDDAARVAESAGLDGAAGRSAARRRCSRRHTGRTGGDERDAVPAGGRAGGAGGCRRRPRVCADARGAAGGGAAGGGAAGGGGEEEERGRRRAAADAPAEEEGCARCATRRSGGAAGVRATLVRVEREEEEGEAGGVVVAVLDFAPLPVRCGPDGEAWPEGATCWRPPVARCASCCEGRGRRRTRTAAEGMVGYATTEGGGVVDAHTHARVPREAWEAEVRRRERHRARKAATLPRQYVIATRGAIHRWDASLKRVVSAGPRAVGLLLRLRA